jgi:hypothetical protein
MNTLLQSPNIDLDVHTLAKRKQRAVAKFQRRAEELIQLMPKVRNEKLTQAAILIEQATDLVTLAHTEFDNV